MRKDFKTKLWYLENFSMFDALTEKERSMLDHLTVMKFRPKHQILYFDSDDADTVYILKKGNVKIYTVSDKGKEVILTYLGPGEIFGEMSLTSSPDKRGEIAEVTNDALVCMIKARDLQEIMQNNPKFNREVLKFIGLKFKKIRSRLESLIFKTSDERIISFLKEAATEYGNTILGEPNLREVKLGLTHADIAKLTATSRQTVTTVLNDLEKKGLISYNRRRIRVEDYKKLQSLG